VAKRRELHWLSSQRPADVATEPAWLQPLEGGDQAYPQMLAAIRGASRAGS